jgi:transcriptional regulator with XRE-family HTH domain
VAQKRLDNYLRAYRKQSGLTQGEVAFLLGWENSAQVSRYEKRRRLPPIDTALACEAIFGVPISELFAGVRDSSNHEVRKRMVQLRSKLQMANAKGSEALVLAHKLSWLDARESLPSQSP